MRSSCGGELFHSTNRQTLGFSVSFGVNMMFSGISRYNYDLNGNLHLLNPGNSGRLTPLRYDLRDRITRLGDVQYRLDDDGVLRQRGAEIFEYNSKGADFYVQYYKYITKCGSAELSFVYFLKLLFVHDKSV